MRARQGGVRLHEVARQKERRRARARVARIDNDSLAPRRRWPRRRTSARRRCCCVCDAHDLAAQQPAERLHQRVARQPDAARRERAGPAPDPPPVARRASRRRSRHPPGIDEELQSECERKRFVRMLAAERDELVLGRCTRENVSVRHAPHRDVTDDRPAVRARNRDRERVRPRELRTTVGMAESWGRRGGQDGDETAARQPVVPSSRAPRSGSSRARRSAAPPPADPRVGLADRGQRQVAECAAALPALVTGLGDHALRLGVGSSPCRLSSQSTRASPCPRLPRRSASRKWSVRVRESLSENPSARIRSSTCTRRGYFTTWLGKRRSRAVCLRRGLVRGQCAGQPLAVATARGTQASRKDEARSTAGHPQRAAPGMPMAMYHEEPGQELPRATGGVPPDRGGRGASAQGLGLSSIARLPRPLTKHVILGARDDAPALVLAVGARKGRRPIPSSRRRLGLHVRGVDASNGASPGRSVTRRPGDRPCLGSLRHRRAVCRRGRHLIRRRDRRSVRASCVLPPARPVVRGALRVQTDRPSSCRRAAGARSL